MSADAISSALLPRETVRERFEDARRSGYSGWLWQDVRREDWQTALANIAGVTSAMLTGSGDVALEAGDPLTLSVAAYTSGMGPLLGHWIDTGAVMAPTDIADVMRLHLVHNRARMAQLAGTARGVVESLSEAGVTAVIVKGMHTAFDYFPEPGTRPLSDIDIHVPMSSMATAERVFAARGYRQNVRMRAPYSCDWTLEGQRAEPLTLTFVHRDDPWMLDVQGSLNRRLLTGRQIRLDRMFAPERTQAWALSASARTLRQPLLALQLAAHISQTLVSATLLRIAELALVLRRDTASGALDWNEFVIGAKKIGGAHYVCPALMFCERLAPGTVPAFALDACLADSPRNLRQVVAGLSVWRAQPIDRHSFRERFMWAGNWLECAQQVAGEFALDGRRQPLATTVHSIGNKLWALRRRRYTA